MPQALIPVASMAAGATGLAAAGGSMLAAVSSGMMLAGGAIGLVGGIMGADKLSGVGNLMAGLGGLGTLGAGVTQGKGLLGTLKPQGTTAATQTAATTPRTLQEFERGFLPSSAELTRMGKPITQTLDKAMSEDILTTLKKYDTIATVLGGAGQGYFAFKQHELGKGALDVQRERLGLERERQALETEIIKRRQAALGTVPQIRVPQQTGLLGQ